MAKSEADFVPKNVKEQGEKADALVKNKGKKATPVETPVETPPVETAPAAEEPAIPANVAPVDPAKPAPASSDFEQKYKVLQGKYDREIMDLSAGMKGMQDTVNSQAQIIENLNNVLQNLPTGTGPAQNAAPSTTPMTDASVFSGYGSEMVDFVDAVNTLIARVDKLEAGGGSAPNSIVARMETIEQRQVKSAKDTFYDALDLHVPEWGNINVDPAFKAWLKEIDPMSDIPREAMLKRALDTFNQNQAIAIFTGFKGLNPVNPNAPAPVVDPLAGQIVPDQTGNVDPSQPARPAARYASLEEFTKAQTDFIKKRITELEFNKIANSYQSGLAAAKALQR